MLDTWNVVRKEERVADLGQGWKAKLTIDRDQQTETLVVTHHRHGEVTLPTASVDTLRAILNEASKLE